MMKFSLIKTFSTCFCLIVGMSHQSVTADVHTQKQKNVTLPQASASPASKASGSTAPVVSTSGTTARTDQIKPINPTVTPDEVVLWGGVSLASYAETVEEQIKAMPVIGQLLLCRNTSEGCDGNDVNTIARDALTKVKFRDFSVEVGTVNTNQLQGFIITPVITSESIVEAFEGNKIGYSYSYRIFGNLMILQFLPGEVRYAGAYPFILNHFDIQPKKLTEEQKRSVFRSLYLNNRIGVNYFQKLAESTTKKLRLSQKDHNYIQVNSVELSDEVQKVLAQSYDPNSWKQQIASFFESNLALATGSPILPSAVGEQTAKQLQIVFRDGNAKLIIPPAGFSISILVDKFLRHQVKSGSERIVCFMVALNITVTDPYDEKIGDLRFARKQDACGATEPGTLRADTMYFPESMYSLLYQITQQFEGKIDNKFLSRNVENQQKAKAEIQKLTKTMFVN